MNANNNKSTSHKIPAENVTQTYGPIELYNVIADRLFYCPHGSKIYNEILLECKDLDKYIKTDASKKHRDQNVSPLRHSVNDVVGKLSQTVGASQYIQNDEHVENTMTTKWPPVSINIIDSDNIHVCMCSQISAETKVDNDSVDGSICPECRNIIKKQPAEPRYRLISKRLMLTNNIIVNRIDTQHLSTYFDISQKRQDPYTPESVESYSPCPELNSSTSTTSSDSPAMDSRQLLDVDCKNITLQAQSLSDLNIDDVKDYVSSNKHIKEAVNSGHSIKKQQRGVVSPVQLKSRLEDLQKKSSIQNLKYYSEKDGDAVGNSDVEDVDDICQTSANAAVQQYPSSCLPKCCNIH